MGSVTHGVSTRMNFDIAFDRLMGHEGGYVNNPNDPGGETNWGISKRSYPDVDIKNLTREDAKVIYKRDYWDKIDGDHLPLSIAFQLFDFAVNSSVDTALSCWEPIKFSQTYIHAQLIVLLASRLKFMTNINGWKTFGRGWARRIVNNLRYAAKDSSDKYYS